MAGIEERLERLRKKLVEKQEELGIAEHDPTMPEEAKDLLRAQVRELEAEIQRLEERQRKEGIEQWPKPTAQRDRMFPQGPSEGPTSGRTHMFPPEYLPPDHKPQVPQPKPDEPKIPQQTQDALTRSEEFAERLVREVEAEKRYEEATRDGSVSDEEREHLYRELAAKRQESREMFQSPEQIRKDNALLNEHSQEQGRKIQEIEPEIKFLREELQEVNDTVRNQNNRLQFLLDNGDDKLRDAYRKEFPITERDIEEDQRRNQGVGR